MSHGSTPAPRASASGARAPGATPAAAPSWLIAATGALIAAWFAVMRQFGASIYALLGPFAVVVSVVMAVAMRARLLEWLRPSWRGVALGLLVGVAMTLATYPLYALGSWLYPGLRVDVAVLYAGARAGSLTEALPWVLAIIVAEELLWRGALLELLSTRLSPRLAMAISVATYAFAQAGSGSPIVALLAVACGTLWTLQRRLTCSLLSPLIAHLIWTPTVILFFPVNA
jgi:uncharacterized protein